MAGTIAYHHKLWWEPENAVDRREEQFSIERKSETTEAGKSSLIAIFGVYLSAVSVPAMANGGPVVWIAPSLHRVGMTDAAGTGTQVSLASARDGYQSFQIVVTGESSLSNVNLKVSDLEGPHGESNPRTTFTHYPEKNLNVTASSPNWGWSMSSAG